MEIRAGRLSDLDHLIDLDGTIESTAYLHVDAAAPEGVEGLAMAFRLEERPLREKRIDRNDVGEDARFALKQLLGGVEDGIVRAVEHDGHVMALAAARHDAARDVLELIDVRVDYEYRRQGFGSGLVFQVINHARELGVRAVTATTLTNNVPAARFLLKSGFDLCGLDTRRNGNHDLVKEAVALVWYAALT
jgi:RimJ/RimL family protein N-acetyltransferase